MYNKQDSFWDVIARQAGNIVPNPPGVNPAGTLDPGQDPVLASMLTDALGFEDPGMKRPEPEEEDKPTCSDKPKGLDAKLTNAFAGIGFSVAQQLFKNKQRQVTVLRGNNAPSQPWTV